MQSLLYMDELKNFPASRTLAALASNNNKHLTMKRAPNGSGTLETGSLKALDENNNCPSNDGLSTEQMDNIELSCEGRRASSARGWTNRLLDLKPVVPPSVTVKQSDLVYYPYRSPKNTRSTTVSKFSTPNLFKEPEYKGIDKASQNYHSVSRATDFAVGCNPISQDLFHQSSKSSATNGSREIPKRHSAYLPRDYRKTAESWDLSLGLSIGPTSSCSYPAEFHQLPGTTHPFFTPPRPAHDNLWSSTPKASSNGIPLEGGDSQALDLSSTSPIRSAPERIFSFSQTEPCDLSVRSLPRDEVTCVKVLDFSRKSVVIYAGQITPETNESDLDFSIDDAVDPYLEDDTGERLGNIQKCGYCSRLFQPTISLLAYEMHIYRHTRSRPYSCADCQNATFPARYYLQNHYSLPHRLLGFRDFETYSCSLCRVVFQTMQEFDLHLQYCLCDSSSCPEVAKKQKKKKLDTTASAQNTLAGDKQSVKQEELKGKPAVDLVNVKTKKRDKGSYGCDYCAKSLASKSALSRHVAQIHHGGNQGHPCPVCSKEFSSQYNMKIHQRIHTGDKPYPCDICGEKFRVKCTMQSHKHRAHRDVSGDCLSHDETTSSQHESGFAEAADPADNAAEAAGTEKVDETFVPECQRGALFENADEGAIDLSETRSSWRSDDTGINFKTEGCP